jgi:hypothetical protein
LDLASNTLVGSLPSTLGLLTRLSKFRVFAPKRTACLTVVEVPVELTHDRFSFSPVCVARLELFDNRLTSLIPPSLGELVFLTIFDVGSNDLSGPIPTELALLADLGMYKNDRNHERSTRCPSFENSKVL